VAAQVQLQVQLQESPAVIVSSRSGSSMGSTRSIMFALRTKI